MVRSVSRLRRQPPPSHMQPLIDRQDGRCFWCGELFGDWIRRKLRLYQLKPTWDHLIPVSYRYSRDSKQCVISCQVCNTLRCNVMFDTTDEIRRYILKLRAKLRYEMVT